MWNSLWLKAPGAFLAATFLVSSILVSCGGSTLPREATGNRNTITSLSRVALEIPTITCPSCELRIRASLARVPGVKEVKFNNQRVTISYDPVKTSVEAIVKAIERRGDRVAQISRLP